MFTLEVLTLLWAEPMRRTDLTSTLINQSESRIWELWVGSQIQISVWLNPSPHVKRVKVYALPKVVGFLQVLRFPPTGKVDRVG
jgi:hypothetical protein